MSDLFDYQKIINKLSQSNLDMEEIHERLDHLNDDIDEKIVTPLVEGGADIEDCCCDRAKRREKAKKHE